MSRRELFHGTFRCPGPGHELIEARSGPKIDEPGEHVGEVGLRIDAGQFAGLDERSDASPVLLSSVGGTTSRPSLTVPERKQLVPVTDLGLTRKKIHSSKTKLTPNCGWRPGSRGRCAHEEVADEGSSGTGIANPPQMQDIVQQVLELF